MNKLKLLIIGGDGLLGNELYSLASAGNFNAEKIDIGNIDIANSGSVLSFFAGKSFDWIINCAAYTDVDGAETNKEAAMKINADGPENLAKIAKEKNIKLLHISTDMVFGGDDSVSEFSEDNPVTPVNEYGHSKSEGEKRVMNLYPDNSWIIRTAWLYGGQGDNKKGFVIKVIEWANKFEEIKIVTDEVGSPTYVADLAKQILYIISNSKKYGPGIYHVTNTGIVSRYELAKEIINILGLKTKVSEALLRDFNRSAKVAHTSHLKNNKLPPLRNWKDALEEYVGEKLRI